MQFSESEEVEWLQFGTPEIALLRTHKFSNESDTFRRVVGILVNLNTFQQLF